MDTQISFVSLSVEWSDIEQMDAVDINAIDVVIVNDEQLEALVAVLGYSDPDSDVSIDDEDQPTILTDDSFTRGRTEFNLIGEVDGEHGTVTQLGDPLRADDVVVDLRADVQDSFAEFAMGLT